MPIFSVIVPVFNVAPWLRECLDSIAAQTFSDWECVCVDDGSTDASGTILDNYAATDSRFRVIHQQNAGVSIARNRAMDAIQGEFFLFVDGDDAIAPDSLECFANALRETDSDAILCHPYHEFLSEEERNNPPAGFQILASDIQRIELLAGRFQANGYVMSRVFRRTVFGLVRFPTDIAMAEDVRFHSDCLCIPARWSVIRKRYYFYRIGRPGAATKNTTIQMRLENVEALEYVIRNMRDSMKASDHDVRAYVRRFGQSYRNHLTLVFRNWRQLSEGERQRTIDCIQRCRKAAGFWPFRLADHFRLWLWKANYSGFLFTILAFSDRVIDSARNRTKAALASFNSRKKPSTP